MYTVKEYDFPLCKTQFVLLLITGYYGYWVGMVKHRIMNLCMMTIAKATNINRHGCLEVPELHHTGLVNILCIVA